MTVTRAATTRAVIMGGSRLLLALTLFGTGLIHLHLWLSGYRHIATIGPLFLLQAAAAILLGLGVLILRRFRFLSVAAAGFLVATAGGLLLSVEVGLFGFKDSLSAPWAGVSLILEALGAVAGAALGVLTVLKQTRKGD